MEPNSTGIGMLDRFQGHRSFYTEVYTVAPKKGRKLGKPVKT
jgi:hypothetical protein